MGYGRRPKVFASCLVLVTVASLGAVATSCKTRRFESGVRSTSEGAEFVHWIPGNRSHNAIWAEEKAARQGRLQKLVDPQLDDRVFASLSEDRKQAIWGFQWQRDTPVGYSGIPLIVFRAILHDSQKSDSPFKHIWRDLTWYGLTPHPTDFDAAGQLNRISRDRRVLPLGMGWTRSPGTEAEQKSGVGQFLGNLGIDPDVRSQLVQRAFISCGACHTGRVARDDKSIQFLYGAPSTEYDQTAFGKALADTLLVLEEAQRGNRLYDIASRLNASIDTLVKAEDRFPYGNSTQEIFNQASWKSPFAYFLRGKATQTIKSKMPDILRAMPQQLALRNQIVNKLDTAAYRSAAPAVGPQGESLKAPPFNGESPGQLDAFGFGGAIVDVVREQAVGGLQKFPQSEFRPWEYLSWVTFGDTKPFWQEIKDKREVFERRVARYMDAVKGHSPTSPGAEPIVPRFAAKVDPSAIWGERPELRSQANWDGNQKSAGARALSTSLAIVASPKNVDVQGSQYVAKFMAYDPMAHGPADGEQRPPRYPSAAPIYPFAIDESLLSAGQKIFEAKCYTCHHPQNKRIYPIDPKLVPSDRLAQSTNTQEPDVGWVGTDPYRAIQITTPVRNGLLALWNLTCQMRAWCASQDPTGQDHDVFRPRGEVPDQLTGYVAAPLDGIWARAPYLHNGSVPTVRALLVPALRDTKVRCGSGPEVTGFWRGNVLYDQNDLGFEWRKPPFEKCDGTWQAPGTPDQRSPFDEAIGRLINQQPLYPTASKSARIFNTTLVGNSNDGHMGAFLGGAKGETTYWESWTVADVLRDEADAAVSDRLAADALIEYLKTL